MGTPRAGLVPEPLLPANWPRGRGQAWRTDADVKARLNRNCSLYAVSSIVWTHLTVIIDFVSSSFSYKEKRIRKLGQTHKQQEQTGDKDTDVLVTWPKFLPAWTFSAILTLTVAVKHVSFSLPASLLVGLLLWCLLKKHIFRNVLFFDP